MCGRYTAASPQREFEQRLGAKLPFEEAFGRFNIAPTQEVAIVRAGAAPGDGPIGDFVRWGLIPRWAKSMRDRMFINAKSETAFTQTSFRDLAASHAHRCLVVADGFYEFLAAERPSAPKLPVRFVVDDGAPFAMAGLWDVWHDRESGKEIASALILTCAPNAVVAPVHDRMPVVLGGLEEQEAWLSPLDDPTALAALLRPLPAERMTAARVSPKVNDWRNEGPELLEEVAS